MIAGLIGMVIGGLVCVGWVLSLSGGGVSPDAVADAIQKDPVVIMQALNEAAQTARAEQAKQQQEQETAARQEEFRNPKKPEIASHRAIWGPRKAPVTIVEYSDFQCPYCAKGFQNLKKLKSKYKEKVRIVYKHLPLDFHAEAEPAARYFEAIAMQSAQKAYKFHDYIFDNQSSLGQQKEAFLKRAAREAGADLEQMQRDLTSELVNKTLASDLAEAKRFGFSGTPAFLINGVSLKGAYPVEEFSKIIDQHLAQMGEVSQATQ